MAENIYETTRRTVVKTILWRIIGIIWSWIGAYLIILFIPAKYNTAAFLATLIVVFYQSTRMVMYYIYERIWIKTDWGRCKAEEDTIPLIGKIAWIIGITISLVVVFYILITYPSS